MLNIVHLMIYSKTTEQFIEFINKNFKREKHYFILFKGSNPHKMKMDNDTNILILSSKFDLFKFYVFILFLRKYNKIIIHGWYFPWLSLVLFINSYLLKKIYWCMWGGDLEVLFLRQNSLKKTLYRFVDVYCKTRVKAYVTQIKEDFLLLKKNYRIVGKYINSYVYPSNTYKDINVKIKLDSKQGLCIQIGNSAEERNHLEILNRLVIHSKKIDKIYLPLSYGDSGGYVKKLLNQIPKEIEQKVIPLLEILPYDEYIGFLSNIDIAIFPFKKQQAFGNIISLTGMKRTIYLNKESITYKNLTGKGLIYKTIDELNVLSRLSIDQLENNRKIVKRDFSRDRLVKNLEYIFND